MSDKKRNIGVLFGSFNPLHHGHTSIAEYFVNNNYVDEVWFVLSPQNPFKQHFVSDDEAKENFNKEDSDKQKNDYFISTERRLKIMNESLEKYPKFRICDVELSMPKPSYTINTLRKLSSIYPNINFILIIGSDNLEKFKSWKDWENILDDYQVFVYPRNKNDMQYILPKMKLFEDAPLINISSTQIRKEIQGENLIT